MTTATTETAKRNALIAGGICLLLLVLGAYHVRSSYHLTQTKEMAQIKTKINSLWPPPDESILPTKDSITSVWAPTISQLAQQHQIYWAERLQRLAAGLSDKIWLKGATFRTKTEQKLEVDEGWKVIPTTGFQLEGRLHSPTNMQQIDEIGTTILTTLNDPVLGVHWKLLNLERVGSRTVAFSVVSQ